MTFQTLSVIREQLVLAIKRYDEGLNQNKAALDDAWNRLPSDNTDGSPQTKTLERIRSHLIDERATLARALAEFDETDFRG